MLCCRLDRVTTLLASKGSPGAELLGETPRGSQAHLLLRVLPLLHSRCPGSGRMSA